MRCSIDTGARDAGLPRTWSIFKAWCDMKDGGEGG
jgi:hypothetical protein